MTVVTIDPARVLHQPGTTIQQRVAQELKLKGIKFTPHIICPSFPDDLQGPCDWAQDSVTGVITVVQCE